MKNVVKQVLAIVMLLLLGFNLIGCNKAQVSGTFTVVIEESKTDTPTHVYKVNSNKMRDKSKALLSVLDYLEIVYVENAGFISSVGSLVPTSNQWVAIYTTNAVDRDVSGWLPEFEYNGTTVYPSGVGALDMHLNDGCIVYLTIEVY